MFLYSVATDSGWRRGRPDSGPPSSNIGEWHYKHSSTSQFVHIATLLGHDRVSAAEIVHIHSVERGLVELSSEHGVQYIHPSSVMWLKNSARLSGADL